MSIKELTLMNYQVTQNRGLITGETTRADFYRKIDEEVGEFMLAQTANEEAYELADIILVCLNYAKHYEIDIEQQLWENIQHNQKRIA